MASGIVIYSVNYSGQTASITYFPSSGGTINLGSQVLPYFYETEYYAGTYNLVFTNAGGKVCELFVVAEPTPTPTVTPTNTPTTTTTLTATPTQTTTNTPTNTASNTPTPTSSNTPTPTQTQTSTQTQTPSNTPTRTPSQTPTQTATNTPTNTASNTPTNTASNTPTQTGTPTQTPTNTASNTPTQTASQTSTPTSTLTQTPTNTTTNTPTNTASQTETPTSTPTSTPASTPASTSTQTPTPTTTLTSTPTQTPTTTLTATPTQTQTPTPTTTTTLTSTSTPTQTSTQTGTPTQTPSHTPTRPPIEFAENGFWYEEGTGELFASTNLIKRVNWSGVNTGIGFLNPTNVLTLGNLDNGFKIIGLTSGTEPNVLVSDVNGVVYYTPVPTDNVDTASLITLTGGTVSNNVITFVGQNDSTNVTILEIFYENGILSSNRIVSSAGNSITYSGSNANLFKLINTGSGDTIETGDSEGVNFRVDDEGNVYATSKSFVVPNQNKEGYNLRHGSLEGPENGVYFRGKTTASYIITPLEWEWLVDYDTVTVILTSKCGDDIYVKEINSTMITVGGNTCEYSYVVYGERKDIDKMDIDIEN
jgi:hypothetical protein